MRAEEIRTTLTEEAELLMEFGEREQELQQAVLRRDWPSVDAHVAAMVEQSRRFVRLDERRHELIAGAKADMGLRPEAPFGELVDRFPEADRQELHALFRSLQVLVLKVKSMTRSIDSYVRGSLRAAHDVLGEVFPDQKGTLYSRRGRRMHADGRAMVVDRHL